MRYGIAWVSLEDSGIETASSIISNTKQGIESVRKELLRDRSVRKNSIKEFNPDNKPKINNLWR